MRDFTPPHDRTNASCCCSQAEGPFHRNADGGGTPATLARSGSIVSPCLVRLPTEGAALGQARLATGRLAQDRRAAGTDHYALGMAEDGGDLVATGALHVHEVRVRMGHEALQLVTPLLFSRQRVQEILGERHFARSLLTFGAIENTCFTR
uniref:Uncharacterized protein n=1 Tax=Anopheles atroparvus TaxID=41427 RepID=A0AAG5D400_ANOAO